MRHADEANDGVVVYVKPLSGVGSVRTAYGPILTYPLQQWFNICAYIQSRTGCKLIDSGFGIMMMMMMMKR